MIGRRHYCGLIEAANGNVNLVRVRPSHERQRRAAMGTERTQPPSPPHLLGLSNGEPKAAPTERCPRHERCTTAPPAICTVTVSNVVRLPGRLIAYRTAQATAADSIRVHGCEMDNAVYHRASFSLNVICPCFTLRVPSLTMNVPSMNRWSAVVLRVCLAQAKSRRYLVGH